MERKVSFILGLGIFFFPGIFAWFTLRKGHSVASRIVAFSWVALSFILVMASGGDKSAPAPAPGAPKLAAVPPPAAVKHVPPVAVPATVKVGTEFKLGDYAYTIDEVSVASRIGKGYGKKKATKGAMFVYDEKVTPSPGQTVASDGSVAPTGSLTVSVAAAVSTEPQAPVTATISTNAISVPTRS